MRPALALAFCLIPVAAGAEEAAAPAGVLTRPPELLGFVEAPYPADAEAERAEGDVLLEVDLSEAGAVTAVRIVGPSGRASFDEAAKAAVERFRFSPAEIDGKPAAVTITYRYQFRYKAPPPPPPEPDAPPPPPEVTFRGQVVVLGKKDPVAGAAVDVGGGAYTAFTGADGRFELRGVPPGTHAVVIEVPGYARFETVEEVEAGKITEARYFLRPKGRGGFEAVVTGQRERKEVAKVTVSAEEIRAIPGTNGDTIRVVQNLPGVARAPFGFGVLLVRGGAPQDTRGYIDGLWVPLVFHFGGLRSVYASELVEDVAFYAGNFGARYGRAIGGAIEVESRDARTDRLHLVADASLIDALALVEGPVTEDLAVAAAVRRSYVDAVLVAVLPESAGVSFLVAPRYYDYQLKATYTLGKDEKVYASFFGAEDKLGFLVEDPQQFDPESRESFENLTRFNRFLLGWEKQLSPTVKHRLEAGPMLDHISVKGGQDLGFTLDFAGASLRDDLSIELGKDLELTVGVDVLAGHIAYDTSFVQAPTQGQLYTPVASANLIVEEETFWQVAPAAYAELVWKPVESVKLVPGVRQDWDLLMEDTWTDLRFATFWSVTETTVAKGAVGLYHQPPQIAQLSPKFGNPDLLPEAAWQYMLGGEQRLGDHLSLDLQLYYKDLFQLAALTAATKVEDGQVKPLRFDSAGTGRSYGAEVLLRWTDDDNLFGWLAYTLSKSERVSLITGELAPFPLDQPHNLTLVASYLFGESGWQVGTRIRYATGNPYTPWAGSIYDADGDRYLPIPGQLYSRRARDFFQADVRVDRHFLFEQWRLSLYLDVQNVTNQSNVEALQSNYDFSRRQELSSLPIFPSLGVRAEY